MCDDLAGYSVATNNEDLIVFGNKELKDECLLNLNVWNRILVRTDSISFFGESSKTSSGEVRCSFSNSDYLSALLYSGSTQRNKCTGTIIWEFIEKETLENYYRFSDNQCSQISLLESEKTLNDYVLLSECESEIIEEECKIDSNCPQSCFGYSCDDGKCMPKTGMPSPPCEEAKYLSYPDCKWDTLDCGVCLDVISYDLIDNKCTLIGCGEGKYNSLTECEEDIDEVGFFQKIINYFKDFISESPKDRTLINVTIITLIFVMLSLFIWVLIKLIKKR